MLKELRKRLSNPGTILTIVSAGVLIAQNLGIIVDDEAIMRVVGSLCVIGIALGVLNDPTTDGIYNPLRGGKKDDK